MATTVGVGSSEDTNSRRAGIQAATQAASQLGGAPCDLVLLFATSRHDPKAVAQGVRSVLGPARIVGGHAVGVMTNDFLGYDGYQVGLAAIASPSLEITTFIEGDIADRETDAGRALGKRIAETDYAGEPNILLMYDSVKRPLSQGLLLNMATPLLAGISEAVDPWPRAAGVGLLGALQWDQGALWCDDQVEHGAALALVLSGDVRMDTVILHGCRPAGPYHTVTKVDGPTVLEIDGRPALDVVDELIGGNGSKSWEDYPLWVTLGINKGDKFGEFQEADYANRLCLAIDRDQRGVVMFEPDLTEGSEVQLMYRSVDFSYIEGRIASLFEQAGDRAPFLVLYFDCAGRASVICSTEGEEGAEVQRCIGDRVPLLGMYSGVEIAKMGPDMQALDWTGVVCMFSH